MKKVLNRSILFLALVPLLFVGCSFYIPSDFYGNDSIRHHWVILDISPDDSSVYLNGKFIGLANEFSLKGSPLKLRSLDNELFFKKKGYIEKAVVLADIYHFSDNRIFITEELKINPRFVGSVKLGTKKMEVPVEYRDKKVIVQDSIKPKPKEENQPQKSIRGTVIFSHQDAAIFLDNKFIGISPASRSIDNLSLTQDEHTLSVYKPGFIKWVKTFDLSDKNRFKITVRLEKEPTIDN